MGALGGDRDRRASLLARYFYHRKPGDPGHARAAAQARCTACSTTSGTWTRSTTSCSSTDSARAAARLLGAFDRNVVDGGVNGAGWLTRFTSRVSDVVGHLDHRRRGALRLVLVKMLSYPVCILQTGRVQAYALLRGGRGPGVLRLLRCAVTIWTSTYSASSSSRRWPGSLVLLFLPGQSKDADPRVGEPGRLRRVPGLAAAGFALRHGRRRVPVRGTRRLDPLAGRATTTSASTASACCWSCSPR